MRWTPYPAREVARYMLDEVFGPGEGSCEEACRTDRGAPLGGPAFRLTAFQEEARRRIDAILRRHRGAILADSVGLGKTYVALDLVEREVAAGREVVVVVPASLRRQWRTLLRRVGAGWTLLTHTALSRGRGPAQSATPSLIVVDEAHRFRNPRARRYAALARMTWSKRRPRVLLITATPVNNHARDLLHLVRLFLPDDGLLDAGVPSLAGAFDPDQADRTGVRLVVERVVVRRTRALLGDRFGATSAMDAGSSARPRFPGRAKPRVVHYQDPALARLVSIIADLELAPYEARLSAHAGTGGPGAGAAGAGAGALLRLSLLKRLDSSPAAFLSSIGRLGSVLEAVRDAARAGRLLAPGAMMAGPGDGDPLQLALVDVLSDAARPGVDLVALADSAGRDLARLARMRGIRGRADPKSEALIPLLSRLAPDRVVVFTEYRDTAAALWRILRGRHRVGRVDGAGAWLGDRPAGRRTVVERFAPAAHGRPEPPARERVDVLIATDVLAEGLNLQDARHVISYDLPWNPVRLMQRIGRVDRLGSPHGVVVPHLFAPADGLDAMLGLRHRLIAKLDGITGTGGGEDAGPFLSALAPGGVDDVDLERAGVPDPMESLRTLWIRTRPRAPVEVGRGTGECGIPWGTATARAPAAAGLAWVVAVRDAAGVRLLEVGSDRQVREPTAAAVAAFEAALDGADDAASDGAPAPVAGPPPRWLEPHLHRYLLQRPRRGAWLPELPRSAGARGLALKLSDALARAGVSAGREQVRRAGALLERLAHPLDPAAEARARMGLADLRGTPDLDALLDRIRDALGDPGPTRAGRDEDREAPPDSRQERAVLAALRVATKGARSPVDAVGG